MSDNVQTQGYCAVGGSARLPARLLFGLAFGSQTWNGRIDRFASDADDLEPVIDA